MALARAGELDLDQEQVHSLSIPEQSPPARSGGSLESARWADRRARSPERERAGSLRRLDSANLRAGNRRTVSAAIQSQGMGARAGGTRFSLGGRARCRSVARGGGSFHLLE